MSDNTETLSLPSSGKPTREAKLLVQDAADILGAPTVKRAESKTYIRRWTGERIMREQPRRFRLIVSMYREGLSVRQICRAAHCDARSVHSCVQLDSEAMPAVKKRLTSATARVARMSIERIEEEIKTMPLNLLGMTFGIAIDKLQNLTGDTNFIVQHNISDNRGNIFDRMAELYQGMKTIRAEVIESKPLTIEA